MSARERLPSWWQAEDREELLASVLKTVQQVWEADSERRRCLERSARLYGPGLGLGRWQGEAGRYGALSLNVVRALCQTASAKLLETAPPRAQYVTDEADWDTQRRAKGTSQLAEAALYRTAFDEQARGDTLLSAALGTACSKILEGHDGLPCVERVFPWELLVDSKDGFDGKPRSLYQIAPIDREALRARFAPEDDDESEEAHALRAAIEEAEGAGLDATESDDSVIDEVVLLEAWHLPSSRGAGDGRHVIFTDHGILVDEPWEESSFPFAFFRWTRPLTGFWSPGVGDEIWTLQYEINLVLERIRQMLHTVAVPRVWLEEGSAASPASLTNEILARHYYRGAKPIIETARAVAPELWQYLEYLWSKAYALLGISELAASAMKPAGVDSGKALRIYADLTSGRLRGWSLAWQAYYLQVSEQLVALLRRGSRRGRAELSYLDPQSRRLRRVRVADVALKEGTYAVQCLPVSSLPSTPAARVQVLDEWLNSGLVDVPTYKRLLDVPDLGAETALELAPTEACEASIWAVLYGDDDEAAQARRPGKYDDPAVWLSRGPRHLLRAQMAGCPEDRIVLLEEMLAEAAALDEERRAAMAAEAGASAPAGAPGAAPPEAVAA